MTRPTVETSVAIRDTLQRYMACIDMGDWEGMIECFSPNSQSVYNGDPQVLVGGAGVAAFVQRAAAHYVSTVHDLAGCHIELTGDGIAHVRSRAIIAAQLAEEGVVSLRAIAYDDELRESDGTWLIVRRQHVALWQSDVSTIPPLLQITEPKGS